MRYKDNIDRQKVKALQKRLERENPQITLKDKKGNFHRYNDLNDKNRYRIVLEYYLWELELEKREKAMRRKRRRIKWV